MANLMDMAVVVAVLAALVLLLRWTWGRGHSLVARAPRRGAPAEYGLLVPVAEPDSEGAAERISGLLREAGIRHTVVPTTSGLRVMVWPADAPRAERALR